MFLVLMSTLLLLVNSLVLRILHLLLLLLDANLIPEEPSVLGVVEGTMKLGGGHLDREQLK